MDSVASAVQRLDALATSPVVRRLSDAFSAAGHELAVVGGPVRDAFLGRAVNDLDFTTSARPDEILATVTPISETQWDMGRDFGTIGALILGEPVEITTYRADAYDGETRKPLVEFGDSLEGDLARRDPRCRSGMIRSGCCARPGSPASSVSPSPTRPLRQ